MKKEISETKINDKKISEQMQEGFEITSDSYSVMKLYKYVKNGRIHDAPYQRGDVWDSGRKKALIESIVKYGGKKVPALVFRVIEDGTMEVVDGKQRLLSSIIPFIDNEFSLNGVTTKAFTGYKMKDIEENYPKSYSAFMTTEIPVLILSNMSDEEAIIYFHQVNSSGVKMSYGEKIHAMQDTPILNAIEHLTVHKVWDNVRYVSRYNDYEYISKMLLYVKDTKPMDGVFKADNKHKLLKDLDAYRSTPVPSELVESVEKAFDFLEKVFNKYTFKVSIREFYNIFTFVTIHVDELHVSDFGKFLQELYYFIHETNEVREMNRFRMLKDKHSEKGYSYTSEFYKWYDNELSRMFARFVRGDDWNDIKQLSS